MEEKKTKKRPFHKTVTADELIQQHSTAEPFSYADMSEVVIDCADIPQSSKILPWLQYVANGVLKHITHDKFSKTDEMVAFNQDPIIRCMLDTLVQRAGGITRWDTGDAGWSQLYAIRSGEKEQPCAGSMGYILSYYQYQKDEARKDMENLDESLYEDQYDGGPGCLDMGPCYIEEISSDDEQRRKS